MGESLVVFAVGTLGSVLRELVPAFERETGVNVELSLANPAATVDRVRRGDPADVAIVANSVWDAFIAVPRVDPQDYVRLTRTTFSAALKPGASVADVSTMAAVRDLFAGAGSLGLVDRSLSTVSLLRGFEALGLTSEMAKKTKTFPTGEAVAEALAHGEVDLGVTTTSELRSVPGIVVLGPFPREIAPPDSVTMGGVLRDATNPDDGRRLLAYLTAPAVQDVFARMGHIPV
jgi:molybdate transport system substrate-binding protein